MENQKVLKWNKKIKKFSLGLLVIAFILRIVTAGFESDIRIFSTALFIAAVVNIIKNRRMIFASSEAVILDEESVSQKGKDKILWNEIARIYTKNEKTITGVWFYNKNNQLLGGVEKIELMEDSENIAKIIKEFWEKYR